MVSTDHDLVHFNLAIAKHALDHPSMAGFVGQLDAVNRMAEASPGFVWTAADGEAGDAAATFGSALVLANISTWRSLEDLRRFVYEGLHGQALDRRTRVVEAHRGNAYVLWWCQPDVDQTGSKPRSGFIIWTYMDRHDVRLHSRGRSVQRAMKCRRAFRPLRKAHVIDGDA